MVTKDKLYSNAIINVFDIKSDSIEVLRNSIKIAFSTHHEVIGFTSTVNTLILYWKDNNDIIRFKKPLDEENCFNFVKDWLHNIEKSDRQKDIIISDSLEDDYGFGFKIVSSNNNYELFKITCMDLYYD